MEINLAQMEEEEAMRQNHKKHGNYVWKQRKTQKGNFVADLALFWKKYRKKANNIADRSNILVYDYVVLGTYYNLDVTSAPATAQSSYWIFHGLCFAIY